MNIELRVWSSIKTMWNSFTNSCRLEHQSNGVSEHRNRTLLDMVQSMMSLTDLP